MSEDHKLILGDCLDPLRGLASLADKSVDHCITDPPFSPGMYERIRGNGGFFRGSPAVCDIGAATPELIDGASREMARVVSRWVLVFSDIELAPSWRDALTLHGLKYVRCGIWIRRGAPQVTGDRPAHAFEAITIAHAQTAEKGFRGVPKMRWNGGGKWSAWETDIERHERFHPTQKPIELMEQLVRDFTDPMELICDPFSGGGTTGVACKKLARRFVGWEQKATFWERAVRRLEGTRQQYELLPRGPKPKQQKMVLP